MKWKDLQPGDIIEDPYFVGNDHALLAKQGVFGTWISLSTGQITLRDEESPLDDVQIRDFKVWRGGKKVR